MFYYEYVNVFVLRVCYVCWCALFIGAASASLAVLGALYSMCFLSDSADDVGRIPKRPHNVLGRCVHVHAASARRTGSALNHRRTHLSLVWGLLYGCSLQRILRRLRILLRRLFRLLALLADSRRRLVLIATIRRRMGLNEERVTTWLWAALAVLFRHPLARRWVGVVLYALRTETEVRHGTGE